LSDEHLVRIGSRPSRLSQAQTTLVADLLRARFKEIRIDVVPISTQGDRSGPDRRAAKGAKGAFTGDIESKLLEEKIDLAVHSMKDLPNQIAEGLAVGATPPRADPRDGLLANRGATFRSLPRGSRVGTGSLRRKAQLLRMRGDIEVVDLAGNVDTRIRKLSSGYDAIVLAVAGLERIGEAGRLAQVFSLDEMVPSACQGVIAVEVREGDERMTRMLSKIEHGPTRMEAECERAFSKALGGDCSVPAGCCARVSGASITAVGMIASEDGRDLLRDKLGAPAAQATALGERLAKGLLESGGAEMLKGAAS
jgi:hydroxymethylbilane synthase